MKSVIITAVILILVACTSGATTHTVTNISNSFSPASLVINLGDTVLFSIASIHNVVEVSQATWNSNGSTPTPGGFSLGFGGGSVVITTTGIHYYVCSPHAFIGMKGTITVDPATGVDADENAAPRQFSLSANYPNPFNPSTSIAFTLARRSFTEIGVYDGIGRRVATLVSAALPEGTHSVTWDGLDAKGSPVGSGPYFIRMTAKNDAKDYFAVRKILLVR